MSYSRMPLRRPGRTTGIAWLSMLTFVAAIALLGDQLGLVGDPDRQFENFFADPDRRLEALLGGYLLALAGIAFLGALAGVGGRLRTEDAEVARWLLGGGGVLCVGLLLAAAAALSAVAWSLTLADFFDEDPHAFSPEAIRLAAQLGWGLLVFAGLAASFTVATAGYLAATVGAAPRAFTWFSVVVAGLLLLSVVHVLLLVLPLWTIVAARWIQVDRDPLSPPAG